MKSFYILFFTLLFLSGCAHHRDVRPGVDGIHRVSIKTDDKEEGSRNAISQANHFCKERNQYAAFVEEKQTYTGEMDEQTYKKGKIAAKVAQGVGSAGWVFGGKKESKLGGVVGLGGGIADSVLGNGYTFDMRFKCQ